MQRSHNRLRPCQCPLSVSGYWFPLCPRVQDVDGAGAKAIADAIERKYNRRFGDEQVIGYGKIFIT